MNYNNFLQLNNILSWTTVIKVLEKYWHHLFLHTNKVRSANKEMRILTIWIKCFKFLASRQMASCQAGPRLKHINDDVTMLRVTMTCSGQRGAIIRGAVCESTLGVLCITLSRIYHTSTLPRNWPSFSVFNEERCIELDFCLIQGKIAVCTVIVSASESIYNKEEQIVTLIIKISSNQLWERLDLQSIGLSPDLKIWLI